MFTGDVAVEYQPGRELAFRNEMKKRIMTEASLQKSETRLKRLLNGLPCGLAWTDAQTGMAFVNDKFTELFGYTADDAQDQYSRHQRDNRLVCDMAVHG